MTENFDLNGGLLMKTNYFKIMTLMTLIAVAQVQAVEWNPSKWSCETAKSYVNTVVDYTNASIRSVAPGVHYALNGAECAINALSDGAVYVGKGLVSVLPQPAAKPVEKRDIELAQSRAENYSDKKQLEATKHEVAARAAKREAEFIRLNVSRDITEKTNAMSKACGVINEESSCNQALADLQASIAFAGARVSDRNNAIAESHKAGKDYVKYQNKEKHYRAIVAENPFKPKQGVNRDQELLEQSIKWDKHLDKAALATAKEQLKKPTVVNAPTVVTTPTVANTTTIMNSIYACGSNYAATLYSDMENRRKYGEVFSLTTDDSITHTAFTAGVIGLAVVARKTQLAKQAWYQSKAYLMPKKDTSITKNDSSVETILKALLADNPAAPAPTQSPGSGLQVGQKIKYQNKTFRVKEIKTAPTEGSKELGFFAKGKETWDRYFGA
jgi:hypothetical protein